MICDSEEYAGYGGAHHGLLEAVSVAKKTVLQGTSKFTADVNLFQALTVQYCSYHKSMRLRSTNKLSLCWKFRQVNLLRPTRKLVCVIEMPFLHM